MKFNRYIHFLNALFIIFFLSLISACSTMHIKDGPPRYDVDVSKIPDAVPQRVAKSKYGNPSTYYVYGHRYHVLASAEGYDERGIASWYGTKFHGHFTSTRERYNMLAMTGASPVLPIPCYARVTNLQNGKSVIVRINDRGPFAPHRILDLSYAAAKKLGYYNRGTAYVEVATIDVDHPYPYRNNVYKHRKQVLLAQNQIAPKNKYRSASQYHSNSRHELYLQLGAFAQYQNAARLESLVRNYTSRPIRIAETKSSQHELYRVQIGPLAGTSESNKIQETLQRVGLGNAYAITG